MKLSKTMAAFAALVFVSGCASTQRSPPRPAVPPQKFAGPDFISERRRSVEPFAHVMFCTKSPGECVRSQKITAVNLDDDKFDELQAVNRNVNNQITPRDDPADDTWTLSPATGDCEDYAVTKRHVLIARGWPASALRLAIGETDKDQGHLVLVVRTTDGDVVLDNLSDKIEPWRQFSLRWNAIQSSTDPRIWHRV